jgi:hypothetical protein
MDTSASASFARAKFDKDADVAVDTASGGDVSLADGTPLELQGVTPSMRCIAQDFSFDEQFHVVEDLDGMDIVLGMDWMQKYNVSIHLMRHAMRIPCDNKIVELRAPSTA